ncbi:hypothetical protein WOLCODRAFT_153921 [Wolfiporia cocos MD-104 SS10]|uniref:Uncharacterized protein n=1 Tax=Wolfiporia cocos (strain MD-104) TaxID=742152 RepID=A0A2H3K177_WOLCO|nr:hypothetical protein WOLCODRAFT_153921 [Wolfiporia cocos MD-104 SS10]
MHETVLVRALRHDTGDHIVYAAYRQPHRDPHWGIAATAEPKQRETEMDERAGRRRSRRPVTERTSRGHGDQSFFAGPSRGLRSERRARVLASHVPADELALATALEDALGAALDAAAEEATAEEVTTGELAAAEELNTAEELTTAEEVATTELVTTGEDAAAVLVGSSLHPSSVEDGSADEMGAADEVGTADTLKLVADAAAVLVGSSPHPSSDEDATAEDVGMADTVKLVADATAVLDSTTVLDSSPHPSSVEDATAEEVGMAETVKLVADATAVLDSSPQPSSVEDATAEEVGIAETVKVVAEAAAEDASEPDAPTTALEEGTAGEVLTTEERIALDEAMGRPAEVGRVRQVLPDLTDRETVAEGLAEAGAEVAITEEVWTKDGETTAEEDTAKEDETGVDTAKEDETGIDTVKEVATGVDIAKEDEKAEDESEFTGINTGLLENDAVREDVGRAATELETADEVATDDTAALELALTDTTTDEDDAGAELAGSLALALELGAAAVDEGAAVEELALETREGESHSSCVASAQKAIRRST